MNKSIVYFALLTTIHLFIFSANTEASEHQYSSKVQKNTMQIDHNSNYSEDFKKLLRSCDEGNEPACNQASFTLYNLGQMSKVIAISKRMCGAGYGWYCTWLGDIYTDGLKGVNHDPKQGYSYHILGCKKNQKVSCRRLKEFYVKNDGTIIYDIRAKIKLLEKKCSKSMYTTCIDLAVIYNDGIGVAVDHDKALKYFHQGCDAIPTDRRCEAMYANMTGM